MIDYLVFKLRNLFHHLLDTISTNTRFIIYTMLNIMIYFNMIIYQILWNGYIYPFRFKCKKVLNKICSKCMTVILYKEGFKILFEKHQCWIGIVFYSINLCVSQNYILINKRQNENAFEIFCFSIFKENKHPFYPFISVNLYYTIIFNFLFTI